MSLYSQLFDWQKKVVDFAATKKSFGLFLDMGLGKTVQALALAEALAADKIVVITKKSKACETPETPGSWQKWSLSLDKSFKILGRNSDIGDIKESEPQLLILNYEAVYRHDSKTSRSAFLTPFVLAFVKSCRHKKTVLILDESHSIKDPSSVQAKALLSMKRELMCYASDLHTYLLTGTPFTRGFIDVWNQLKFMGCPMTKQEFKDRFCEMGHLRGLLGWQQPIVGYKNVDELYALIHKYAVTLKSSDVIQLPPQSFVEIVSPRTLYFDYLMRERVTESDLAAFMRASGKSLPPNYKLYHVSQNTVLNPFFRNFAFPDDRWLADTPATLWLRARQMSIGFQGNGDSFEWFDTSRFNRLRKLLEDNPDNYVLFYNYVPEFFELFELLNELGYNVDVYNGDIKSLYFYEKFSKQTPAEQLVNRKNVILSNFASGSVGVNWQLYERCIVFSLPVYKDWAQGLKRVCRLDSKNPIIYYIFSQDNWLDKAMRKTLNEGTDYSEEMFSADFQKFGSA